MFVFPVDFSQKQKLLNLKCINETDVKCSLTNSETEYRGVIVGVPVGESHSSLLYLLKYQNVIGVYRFNKSIEGVKCSSLVAVLTFIQPIPYRVPMAYRSFLVRAKHTHCLNCHRIRHTANRCRFPKRCPKCADTLYQPTVKTQLSASIARGIPIGLVVLNEPCTSINLMP